MELTTQQIYALFAIGVCIAVALGITYCAGLKTGNASGYKYGRTTAGKHWRCVIAVMRTTHAETAHQLDAREREIRTLRANIKAEGEDHADVERGLLQRLAAAAPLSDEDQAILEAIAAKLELAAETWQAFPTGADHARFARQLSQHALNMAQRLKAAQANTKPHPDTELIEWLHEEAHFFCDGEHGELRFLLLGDVSSDDHPRAVLRTAKSQAEQLYRNHTASLEAAA